MLTRLTFRQLEYCVAAGEFGSIAEAANRIHVSPSSISSAITQVEAELKIPLFVRHHAQGLSVTPAGAEVLKEILGIGETLAGRLLIWDALSLRSRLVKLRPDPACPACGPHATLTDLSAHKHHTGEPACAL